MTTKAKAIGVIKCDHCGNHVRREKAHYTKSTLDGHTLEWWHCAPCEHNFTTRWMKKTCTACNTYGTHNDEVCQKCGHIEEEN